MSRAISFRTKLLVAFIGLSVLTAAGVLHQAWHEARKAQLEELQELLRATVGAMASGIDGDAHARLDPGAKDLRSDPAWQALAAAGARLKRASPRFQEVYTVSVLDPPRPGVGRFVLSEKPEETGREYEYGRFPCMLAGLQHACADDDVTVDEYGPTLSGYAPIRDAAGRTVAFLGVDVDGSTVEAMRGKLLWILAAGALGAVVVGGGVAWFFASRISRPVEALVHAFGRVAAGDFATRIVRKERDEFGRLAGHFNRMVEGLEERQRLKQALHLAMEIQQHLLPSEPPVVEGLDLAGFSDYCDETGGDYYDYPRTWAVPGGKVALTVGDVTGHGIGAALLMAAGRAVLRSHAERDVLPGEILSVANRHMCRDATAGKFMTLFYGVLDPVAGTMEFSNAGQGGCFVHRAAADRVDAMEALGPPLGVVDGIAFRDGRLEGLRAGDVVVLGTDGIWETADGKGDLFEMERFEAVVRAHAGESARSISDAVRDAVLTHRGTGPQTDDVTLVVAKLGTSPAGAVARPSSAPTA